MPSLDEVEKLHALLHEGGGRREYRARGMQQETVQVTSVVRGRDAYYCRVKREGQAGESTPVKWGGNQATPPSPNDFLKAWYYWRCFGSNALLLPLWEAAGQ